MIHNDHHHTEYHQSYVHLNELYILKLSIKLKFYIQHCRLCQINQIKQYTFYKKLKSILFLLILFHTVTMNFIVVLLIANRYDTLLIVINKFLKKILLILRKTIYSVSDWVKRYLTASMNWDLLKVIISDCNAKFMSVFWQINFQHLKIKLFISIIYHSQIDDQSEWINQIVKNHF